MAQTAGEWEGITVVDRRMTGPDKGLYTVYLSLSEWPDQDWCRMFAGPPLERDQPVVENRTISWQVAKSRLKEAYEIIKTSIDRANSEYAEMLAQRDELKRKAEDRQSAAKNELDALQKELEKFKF